MYKVGCIGSGRMASCIIQTIDQNSYQIVVANPSGNFQTIPQGIATTLKNSDLANCDMIILAVKPQSIAEVAEQLPDVDGLLVSIVAGIGSAQLHELFRAKRIIRAMPNTPAQIHLGTTALWANAEASSQDKEQTAALFSTIGSTIWLPEEKQIHAATAISGSGPAYYFALSQALIESGMALGLSKQTALKLVLNTAIGASALAQDSEDLQQLIAQVCSPNGTTERALSVLQPILKEGIPKTVQAAYKRSQEMGKQT